MSKEEAGISKSAAELLGEEKEAEEEEEETRIILERVYTVPLWKFIYKPYYKRAPKAIRILKQFVTRHMKPEMLVIDPKVNETIWKRGISSPPRRIKVRVTKDNEGTVKVYLA